MKHVSGNMLPDATMSHPDPHQRCILANALVPLLDLMQAQVGFLQSDPQKPLILTSQLSSFTAVVTAMTKSGLIPSKEVDESQWPFCRK